MAKRKPTPHQRELEAIRARWPSAEKIAEQERIRAVLDRALQREAGLRARPTKATPRNKGGRRPKLDPAAVKAERERLRAAGKPHSHSILAKHFDVHRTTITRALNPKPKKKR
jgi:DNA invertase Pin-like site-specific DNA recombinase